MATDIIRPNATGTYNNAFIATGAPATGEAKWEDIDEAVADDATSYIYCGSGTNITDSYNLTSPSASSGTITDVKVYYRGNSSEATNQFATPGLRLSGTDQAGSEITLSGTAWATQNQSIARPGGGSWDWPDFTNLEVINTMRSPNSGVGQCTQIYVEITYTPAAGGAVETNNTIFFGTNF